VCKRGLARVLGRPRLPADSLPQITILPFGVQHQLLCRARRRKRSRDDLSSIEVPTGTTTERPGKYKAFARWYAVIPIGSMNSVRRT
jgi:hypothetical protein